MFDQINVSRAMSTHFGAKLVSLDLLFGNYGGYETEKLTFYY